METRVVPIPRNWWPMRERPLRWRKSMGEAECLVEWLLQNTWLLVPYTAVVSTVVLVLLVVYNV
jgi:hypothetical protein